MTNEKKIHVLADESLGGVKREYVEVKRKAEVGDLIVITKLNEYLDGKYYDEGHFGRVITATSEDICADFNGFGNSFVDDDGKWLAGEGHEGKFAVLEPTDIVHIDGSRFRLVDRKAEVGERVIIVENTTNGREEGYIGIITEVGETGAIIDYRKANYHGEYHVLVPVESEQSPKSTDDIIANLVKRVSSLERKNTELERRLDGTHRDIETWAQEHEKVKRELDDKIEMCIDDIVALDERTTSGSVTNVKITQTIDGKSVHEFMINGNPPTGSIKEIFDMIYGGVRG